MTYACYWVCFVKTSMKRGQRLFRKIIAKDQKPNDQFGSAYGLNWFCPHETSERFSLVLGNHHPFGSWKGEMPTI